MLYTVVNGTDTFKKNLLKKVEKIKKREAKHLGVATDQSSANHVGCTWSTKYC